MSLWPIKTVERVIAYELCDGGTGIYAPDMCVGDKIYKESLNSIGHFFYDPGSDRLVAYVTTRQKAWPSWSALRFDFDPETGEQVARQWTGIWATAWNYHATLGSYNKIFNIYVDGHPQEVDKDTMAHHEGGWRREDITIRYAVVNLEDNLLVGVDDWWLKVYDLSVNPATVRSMMRTPNVPGYLCMENRETAWYISKDGLILKINYKESTPRWEMFSSVQNPAGDATDFLITWDTKRRRLVVFRRRPDDFDGSCQCQLEFYRPLIKVAGLTDPVPMSRPLLGEKTEFVAHLFGASGEGVAPYRVVAELAPTALGVLLKAEGVSAQNGSTSFLYQGPDDFPQYEFSGEEVAGEYTEHGYIALDWILHFDGTLAHVPVVPATVRMHVAVPDTPGIPGSAFEFDVFDLWGEGLLTRQFGGLLIDIGTIDYETGAVHFEFGGQFPEAAPIAQYSTPPAAQDTIVLSATITDGD